MVAGPSKGSLDDGKDFTGSDTAAVLAVEKVCHHLGKLFGKADIGLVNLSKGVVDRSNDLGMKIFFGGSVRLNDFKLRLHLLFVARL